MDDKVYRNLGIGLVMGAAVAVALLWWRRQNSLSLAGERDFSFTSTEPQQPQATAEDDVDCETDPLEMIYGIGPIYARRLRAAGILSYADLAARSADEVLEIVQAEPWQADAARWIETARERAGE